MKSKKAAKSPKSGSVRLEPATYREIKAYCDNNGLVVGKWLVKLAKIEMASNGVQLQ